MLSAGFLLIKPVARPVYVSPEWVEGDVISASDCICPQFPGPYAISWTITPDAEREALFTEVGIPREVHERAIAWATEAFDEAFGWPGVFYTVDAARAARARFFAPDSAMKVIGLGLPEDLAEDFVIEATPPQSPPGYAPNGESGYLECVLSRIAGGRRALLRRRQCG